MTEILEETVPKADQTFDFDIALANAALATLTTRERHVVIMRQAKESDAAISAQIGKPTWVIDGIEAQAKLKLAAFFRAYSEGLRAKAVEEKPEEGPSAPAPD